jgi:hypothetical protein
MFKGLSVRLLALTYALLLGHTLSCSQQHVKNSPCATLNASFQVKPSADLTMVFGNDAIQSAIGAITGALAKQSNMSAHNLSNIGTEAALRTAQASGKTPNSESKVNLETYLRDDVVPAVKQYPTCIFNVASSPKAYVGIDAIGFVNKGNQKVPNVNVKNTGQSETKSQILIKYIVDGKEYGSGTADILLGPGQSRGFSINDADLPIADIEAATRTLFVIVTISYLPEPGSDLESRIEAWKYDSTAKRFYLAPLK